MATMTISDLVQELGGTADLARALGANLSTVSNWRKRGSIPSEHWAAVVAIAAGRGKADITFETIALMHMKKAAPFPAEAAE